MKDLCDDGLLRCAIQKNECKELNLSCSVQRAYCELDMRSSS